MSNNTNMQISVRQMARLLKKFSIRNGDILTVKHQSENANQQAIEKIVAALKSMNVDALVVVVNSFDDLSVLNETEMNRRGWFRLEQLRRLRPVKKEGNENSSESE